MLLPALIAAASGSDGFFSRGNALYQQGAYQEALQEYEKVLADGVHSGSLYFNMGNCCYKLQDIGRAVLYYEKALQLKPGDPDIRANLQIANLAVVDRIVPLEKHLLFNLTEGVVFLLPRQALLIITAAAWVLFMTGLIVMIVSRSRAVQYAARRGAVLFSVLFVLSGIILVGRIKLSADRTDAVVLVEQVRVKSAPNQTGAVDLFSLHEGTKVRVSQDAGDWLEIVLADGKVGWVPQSAVGII